MADKQYTFRTTKSTEWMEDHLNDMKDRSGFIRECVLFAVEHDPKLAQRLYDNITSEIMSQTTIKSHQRTENPSKPKKKVSHQKPQLPVSDKKPAPQIKESKPKILVQQDKEIDLDKALSMNAKQFQ
jgi:hypothetical protein